MSLSQRFKNRLHLLFKQIQDDPLLGISKIIGIMLSSFGIFKCFEWIIVSSNPLLFGSIFLIILLGLFIIYLFRPPATRLFALIRHDRVETITQSYNLTIFANGEGWLSFEQYVLIRGEPKSEDFRDKLHCSGDMNFDDLQYDSPDSTPTSIHRERDDLITVYFKPNKQPKPYTPFKHSFSFRIPETIGPYYYCVRPAINAPMGEFTVSVLSYMPI
ncbi:MAG: hypothetical protein ACOCP4_02310, partial [Candidatus Woesearchaeota archaeon]